MAFVWRTKSLRAAVKYAFATAALAAALLVAAQPEFPQLSGVVVDQAGLISPQVEQAIGAQLLAHQEATSNQVVVVTISQLSGYDIADYGYQLGRDWGIGTADRNNGALLIIAKAERAIRIEVGYGLEGALPDITAGSIIRNEITPRFREGDFDGGIQAGVDAILAAIRGEYSAQTAASVQQGLPGWVIFLGLLILFLVVIAALSSQGGGRYATGGSAGYGGWSGGSGGFGSGGGGFSGGGGSFGGGGASGGW